MGESKYLEILGFGPFVVGQLHYLTATLMIRDSARLLEISYDLNDINSEILDNLTHFVDVLVFIKPLIKFRNFYYFEEKGDPQALEKQLQPLPQSKVLFLVRYPFYKLCNFVHEQAS